MRLGVCLKLVDRRPAVDPLTGAVADDERSAGASDADLAALEAALRAAESWGAEVVAVTAGPAAAEAVLRDALAAGATTAIRVDLAAGAPSHLAAAALAPILSGCAVVWCGDHSLDRGSGSVPAYLAAHLGAAQALGLLAVDVVGAGPEGANPEGARPARLAVTRRLDRGRRERLVVEAPAVVSVEATVARLRRASLTATMRARGASISIVAGPGPGTPSGELASSPHAARIVRPYRPRPRALAAPAGVTALERIVALTAAHTAPSTATVVELAPADAADRILTALRAWGYLDTTPEP